MIETVADLISELNKFPANAKVRNVFDACGNFFYPRPKLKQGEICKDGSAAVVLSMEQEPMNETKETVLVYEDLIDEIELREKKASLPTPMPSASEAPPPEVQHKIMDILQTIQNQYDDGSDEVKAAVGKVVAGFETLVNVLVCGNETLEPEMLPEIAVEYEAEPYADGEVEFDDDDDEVADWFAPRKYA
jgi:hypothetical protein